MTEDEHSLDLCKCGDFRRDHKDGRGSCVFNTHSGGPHGDYHCMKFRLSRPYEDANGGRLVPPHGSGGGGDNLEN